MAHDKRPREETLEVMDPPPRFCVLLHRQGWERMISYLYGCLALILWICRDTSHAVVHRPTPTEVGQQLIVHLARSMVSSPSSSSPNSELYDGQDVWNLIRERREARNLYSKATREVGRLELCHDVVKIAFSTSEEETNVAQMRANEAHARAASKISLKSLSFYIRDFIQ